VKQQLVQLRASVSPPSTLDAAVLSILRNSKKVKYKVIGECVSKNAWCQKRKKKKKKEKKPRQPSESIPGTEKWREVLLHLSSPSIFSHGNMAQLNVALYIHIYIWNVAIA